MEVCEFCFPRNLVNIREYLSAVSPKSANEARHLSRRSSDILKCLLPTKRRSCIPINIVLGFTDVSFIKFSKVCYFKVSHPRCVCWPKVSNCAGVYRLEHNYIVRYIKTSQLHVSALMAVLRLDTKLDKKTIYNMVHYIHTLMYVCNVPYYI